MTKKIRSDDDRRVQMRQRLAAPTHGRNRENSIAGDVRALDSDIARQRALGKPWAEIATNMYEDPNKADAVRAAFARLHGQGRKSDTVTRARNPDAQAANTVVASGASANGFGAAATKPANLFAAIHDPLDEEA